LRLLLVLHRLETIIFIFVIVNGNRKNAWNIDMKDIFEVLWGAVRVMVSADFRRISKPE
jgi:hypothetical protein